MEVNALTCMPRLPPSPRKGVHDVVRPLADYHPSIWGEFFIHSVAPADQKHHAWMQQRVGMLKEEVKTTLANAHGHLVEEMDLVDTLQRLGLAYHFKEEIKEALVRIHEAQVDSEDLHVVSQRFRLLRQEGYNVPSTDFDRFKDADGQFRRSLASNVKGLLSLYEAAYLGTHAEVVLEEAITFCKGMLEPMLHHLQPPLAAEVARALGTPLVRRTRRVEARQYISFYEAAQGRNDSILELAKLDFNILQSLHQEEARNLSVWWKELDIMKTLNFARDRLVEVYFWALGVCYEPHLSRVRMMITKVTVLLSVLDDIYDSYGTLEELDLFTSVIQRWDISAVEELPEYMRICFLALTNTFKDFEEELAEEQKSNGVEYLKEQMKLMILAYHEEAKWNNKAYVPTLEEHLHVSLISCGYRMITCSYFLGMGDIVTKETFDWLTSFPQIVKASAIICRIMDDIVSHEFEQKRQHVVSTVQCYMKEYDVSKEKACQKLHGMIEDAWHVINQECLQPSTIEHQVLVTSLNLARAMEMFYKRNDEYTHSFGEIKDLICLLLVECV